MAASKPVQVPAVEKIRQVHLECSLCQEEFTEPKLLDCLHSFCKQCLLKYHTTNYRDAKMLICPVCRQRTQLHENGVEDLKTNSTLTNLAYHLEQVSSSEDKRLICKLCERGNEATLYCFDCPMIICETCNNTHLRIPVLSNHTVALLQDVLGGKIAREEQKRKQLPTCQKHENVAMRFYCTTCDVMICRNCTVIDHCKPEHEYVDYQQASVTCKKALTHLTTPLEDILKKLKRSQASVSTIKDNLDNTVKSTMEEVNKRADEIRAEVAVQESRIMEEIRNLQKDRLKRMEEFQQIVQENSEQIQTSLQIAKDVCSSASSPEFLALHPTISKDLEFLKDQNLPKIDSTLDKVSFEPGSYGIALGNLMARRLELSLGSLEQRWQLSLEYDKGFNRVRGIDACLPGDEAAVADSGNKRLVICNTNIHREKAIQLSRKPRAVAAYQNQFVVVDESKSVKMYNRNGTLAFDFHTLPQVEVGKTAVDLYSVAVMKDTIIVGDLKRSVLSKHSVCDGTLIETVSVKTKPRHLAIDSKDRVIVSGSDQQQVDIVDDSGATLITIKPTISGQQVRNCRGVCCNSSAIYIAVSNEDYNTGHIHQYDTEGRFLRCIAHGLYCPMGISWISDGEKLAIADSRSVKIYNKV